MAGIRLKLLAGTALTLVGAAAAQAASADTHIGWYAAVEAGQTPGATQTLEITDVTLQGTGSTGSVTPLGDEAALKIDRGAAGFARLGYQFTPNIRAEAEFGTRPGAITDGLAGERAPGGLGKVDKASAMVNLIYDIRPDLPLHPFVGIGAGVVQAKTTYAAPSTLNGHARTYTVASEQTVPAAQAIAGASWRVTKRLNFEMIYRFMRTGNMSYDVAATDKYTPTNASAPVTDTYSAKAAGHFSDHSLSVGLRWSFGAPVKSRRASSYASPAPAPLAQATTGVPNTLSVSPAPVAKPAVQPLSPAPAPAAPVAVAALPAPASSETADANPPVMAVPAPKQYTVYFPLNSLRLNNAAKSVIATAAQYAKSAPTPTLTVTGHADTSGSSAYNMALSRKRANVVAGGLKAEGIPSSAITVLWKGEKDLAVRTRDGVTNAKNRRATIDVSF